SASRATSAAPTTANPSSTASARTTPRTARSICSRRREISCTRRRRRRWTPRPPASPKRPRIPSTSGPGQEQTVRASSLLRDLTLELLLIFDVFAARSQWNLFHTPQRNLSVAEILLPEQRN